MSTTPDRPDVTALRDALVNDIRAELRREGVEPTTHLRDRLDALIDAAAARAAAHRWEDCTAGQDCQQPQCNPDEGGNCRACSNPEQRGDAMTTPDRPADVTALRDALLDLHHRMELSMAPTSALAARLDALIDAAARAAVTERVGALETALDTMLGFQYEHGQNCFVAQDVECVCGLDSAVEQVMDVRLNLAVWAVAAVRADATRAAETQR